MSNEARTALALAHEHLRAADAQIAELQARRDALALAARKLEGPAAEEQKREDWTRLRVLLETPKKKVIARATYPEGTGSGVRNWQIEVGLRVDGEDRWLATYSVQTRRGHYGSITRGNVPAEVDLEVRRAYEIRQPGG